MAAIITEKFRQHNADQFFESFSETAANNYYLFIGKTSPFTSGTTGGSDTTPPTPVDTITLDNYKWDSMIAAKRIGTTDVTYVIPRRNYAEGTTYDMYEHDISSSNTTTSGSTNIFDSTFYFVTNEFKVYKVLDNNGGTAIQAGSTGPTTTQSDPFFSGGYYLQYMYTLSTSQIQKFVTTDFIPVVSDSTVVSDVETSSGDTAPFNGAPVKVIKVTGGSGYTDNTYYAPIRGDGTAGVVKIVVSGGEIQPFGNLVGNSQIENAGVGYTYGTVDLTNDIFSSYNSSAALGSRLTGATTLGSGTNGAIVPIISPRIGHGHDPIGELGGHYVMMNAKLEQAEGDDFAVGNDFREVGLMVDPGQFGSTNLFTGTTARQTFAVAFSSSSATFEPDERITQQRTINGVATEAVGRVVEYDATRKILYYLQERFETYGVNTSGDYIEFGGSTDIVGATSGSTGVPAQPGTNPVTLAGGNTLQFDADGYAKPELQPDSGNVIYVENRRPISRASDQTEDIKVVVEF